ncbi:MAG: hypothetical protein K0Q56_1633 [Sporolactobacillus laevolacticus]|nr:hypothetical protein [Sporolactobacillus laevolacticus]
MIVNTEIVQQYLIGKSSNDYSDSWIFHSIEEGQYLFEEPDPGQIPIITQMVEEIQTQLDPFVPFNQDLWDTLFPMTASRLQKVTIQLVVGCPSPYGAMVRTAPDGSETIIFDLIRMSYYKSAQNDVSEIIRKMLTHECAHLLLHQDYPESEANTYREKLSYLLFDEGLAHFLAMDEQVNNYDWTSSETLERKDKAFHDFSEAYKEENPDQQKQNLINACAGAFWDKFACIAGMFRFAEIYQMNRRAGIKYAYQKGWIDFSNDLVNKVG